MSHQFKDKYVNTDVMNRPLLYTETNLFEYTAKPLLICDPPLPGEESVRRAFMNMKMDNDLRYHLKTESYLLKLAHAHNKILSLSNSRTRILAHQVESTHIIVNALNKRFLIADEVGLGKTIEAGLVIKEFIYRFNYTRILIACPASLLNQWQNEMSSKFNEKFTIMDRRLLLKTRKECGDHVNPWEVHPKIICSLDFIKSKSLASELGSVEWDAVIFDEAHRLRRDANHSTQAFITAEMISERTKSLLLLSATPFRGKLEELYFLINLLDKNLLGPYHSFCQEFCSENADLSALRKRISKVVIRRTKKEVGGFTSRHARTIRFDLYPDERHLYEETTRYVAEEFNRAMQTENRAVGFVMTVFQKLLDSSSYALNIALKKRKLRLEENLERAALIVREFSPDDYEDCESIEESLDRYAADKTASEFREEIKTIERLIVIADNITVNKKGEKLVRLIKNLKTKGHKKFLIFTQFRTTQDYLFSILKEFDTCLFHGSMNRDEKEDAILNFKNSHEILIATEAGGEGRNMQFCGILINYDLPWSPLKIEQRIGRLHRFGQPDDVFIYNFSTRDTVAERVLEVLSVKLRLFEESIGTPDVLLGQLEDELNLNNLFMDIASGRKKKKEAEALIDERIQNARRCYDKLSELTVTGRMDFNYDEYYKITLKDRQFSNNRIENFVTAFCNVLKNEEPLAGSFGKKNNGTGHIPVIIDGEKKSATFDSVIALENESLEFLAFGHPIIEKIFSLCRSKEFGGMAGIKFIKWGKPFTGILFNFLATLKSITVTQELIPVLIDTDFSLDRFDIEEIEIETLEQNISDCDAFEYRFVIERALSLFEKSLEAAKVKIADKIHARVSDLSDSLDLNIDPEIDKIKSSYEKKLKELDDKLQLQEAKMKWEGRDMRSAITRTVNSIRKAERDRDNLLSKYSNYLGVTSSVELINAAIIIGAG